MRNYIDIKNQINDKARYITHNQKIYLIVLSNRSKQKTNITGGTS